MYEKSDIELDEPSFVSRLIEANAAAKTVDIGFNPRKVEVVALESGAFAICVKGAEKHLKFAAGVSAVAATLEDPIITFNGDNTVTLGVDADLNASGKDTVLLCYK